MSFISPISTILKTTFIVFLSTVMSIGSVLQVYHYVLNSPITIHFCFLSRCVTSYQLTKSSEIRLSYDLLSTNASAQYVLQYAMTQILLSSLPYPKIAAVFALFARRLQQPLYLLQSFLYQWACCFREDVRAVQAPRRALSRFLTPLKGYERRPSRPLQRHLHPQRTRLAIRSSYVPIINRSCASIVSTLP